MADAMRLAGAIVAIVVGARILGTIARRLRQPAVAGEILAGVLLGPTVLGLVERTPGVDAATKLSAGLFLLAAGLEVDLSAVRRRRRTSLAVAAGGLVFPFALGFLVAWFAPDAFGFEESRHASGAIFLGIALSISALPVIARTLMDLGLFRTDFGMTVIAAAVVDDLVGWVLFSLLVAQAAPAGHSPLWAVLFVPVLALVMLTAVRRGVDRGLPRATRLTGPAGVALLAILLAVAAGSAAHAAGVHAMFGAFLAGIAIGDSEHVPKRTRSLVTRAVEWVCAPLFFGSIGTGVDFGRNFDPALCALILLLACTAKLLGCFAGARATGMPVRRAWAVAAAMNSRGAMEIVLGVLALEAGLIDPRMFVALVIMALVTSLTSGPVVGRLLAPERAEREATSLDPAAARYTPEP